MRHRSLTREAREDWIEISSNGQGFITMEELVAIVNAEGVHNARVEPNIELLVEHGYVLLYPALLGGGAVCSRGVLTGIALNPVPAVSWCSTSASSF